MSNSLPKDAALQNQPDAQEVTQTVMESTPPVASAPLVAGGTKDSHTVTSGIPAPSPVQPTSLGCEAEMPNFAQLSITSSHANQSKVNETKGMNISAKVCREEPSRMLTEPVILAILLFLSKLRSQEEVQRRLKPQFVLLRFQILSARN